MRTRIRRVTPELHQVVIQRFNQGGVTNKDLRMMYGISKETVRRIINHPTYEDYQVFVKNYMKPKQMQMEMPAQTVVPDIRKIIREEIVNALEMIAEKLKEY